MALQPAGKPWHEAGWLAQARACTPPPSGALNKPQLPSHKLATAGAPLLAARPAAPSRKQGKRGSLAGLAAVAPFDALQGSSSLPTKRGGRAQGAGGGGGGGLKLAHGSPCCRSEVSIASGRARGGSPSEMASSDDSADILQQKGERSVNQGFSFEDSECKAWPL